MSIFSRIAALESAVGSIAPPTVCACPDALALGATKYDKTCFECGKSIDLRTWEHWHTFTPGEETNFFAFRLRRDDAQEFDGQPNDFFLAEMVARLRQFF